MTTGARDGTEQVVIGRYMLCDEIGGGGMAKVHVGRVIGAAGFSRVVAIKRLHPATANDPELTTMLVDEARLVSRIRHPNVVPTLDVVSSGRELLLVMEYIHGLALSRLLTLSVERQEPIAVAIVARIVLDVLAGLHAAHEARSERGQPLDIVHRDVSPQNVIVDTDGHARVVDFGIAQAEGKLSMTREGEIKGKLAYMAPEQLRGEEVDRRADVYGVGVMLWELLTGRHLFERTLEGLAGALAEVMTSPVVPPSTYAPVGPEIDAIVVRALQAGPSDRFPTAAEMASAISSVTPTAESRAVAQFVSRVGKEALDARSALLARVEQVSAVHDLPPRQVSRPALAEEAPAPASTPPPPPPPALVDPVPLLAAPDPFAESPPPQKRPVALAAFLIGFALVLAAFAVVLLLPDSPPRPLTTSAATASLIPPPSAPGNAAEEPPDPGPSAVPSQVPSQVVGPTRPLSRVPRPRPSASGQPKPDCDPPYAIDSRGIRIPRRECLGQ
jgi:serine/threonine-protein kinase